MGRAHRLHRSAGLLMALAACGGDDGDTSHDIEGVIVEPVGDYVHVAADLDYDRPAPSGGDHLPGSTWLNCGVYEGAVPEELAVHSLEHGAVWIALGPEASAADRTGATELLERADGRAFVSDVADLDNAVELVAWGFRLPLDSIDDERAAAFLDEYIDASSAPEAGAPCAGSHGEPPVPPELPAE